jgi:transposase
MAVTAAGTIKKNRNAIDTHPERENIVQELIEGKTSNRALAKKYGVSHGSINRYVRLRLIPDIAAAARKRSDHAGSAILGRIEDVVERIQKLYDACDAYLRDPENPEKYNLFPRAWEMDIVYRMLSPTGKWVYKKADLQALLNELHGTGREPVGVLVKSNDPRKTIIEASRELRGNLELIAKIEGAIREQVINNYTVNQYWVEFKGIVMRATEGYPEVRERIVRELTDGTAG